ncbi:MAG: PQQ-binding-like beta-propeller repeat protein [Candidatus Eisenbacteria bacterium]
MNVGRPVSVVPLALTACLLLITGCSDKTTDTSNGGPESYTLTVDKCGGLWGYPESQETEYTWVDTINYQYALKEGYSDLVVTLDDEIVPDSGSFVMDTQDHTLLALCRRRVLWTVEVEKEVYYCSPAVGDDGTIYISTGAYSITDYGTVYAVSPLGFIQWSYDLEHNAYSPAIGPDGTVYVQDYRSNVYALSPVGELRWKFNDFENPDHSGYPVGQRTVAIGADGTVYVAADGLYAVDPDTGERLWWFNPTPWRNCRQSPVIGADGTIYLSIHQDDFYAVNPDSTEKWHVKFAYEYEMSFTSPAIDDDGAIYLGTEAQGESWVWAFNPDGSVRWKYFVDGYYCYVRGSPTIGSDGTIYVSTKACQEKCGSVIALTPWGTEKWVYSVEEDSSTAPLDDVYCTPTVGADGLIYFGAETACLYALNPDGTLNWKTVLGGINWSSPAIVSDGTLYIGTHKNNPGPHGFLWALETTSMGYATSPWPCYRHDNKNTGRFGGP